MLQFIILIIFIISFGGVLLILAHKIPALISLSQNGSSGIREHKFVVGLHNKVKDFFYFFKKQIFLHKFLSWVKVMTLKIETKVDHLLHRLRKKAQQVDKNIDKPS